MNSSLPLEGVRVIDLTRALAGPFATTLLADLGADVIKIETPAGDMIRGWSPFDGDTSLYHLAVNRNKRSAAIDVRHREGRRLLRRLTLDADVLVENFRPGVLAQIGLDPEELKGASPNLIVTSITGFGPTGPQSGEPCFDQIVQGMGGPHGTHRHRRGPLPGRHPRRGHPCRHVRRAGNNSSLGRSTRRHGKYPGRDVTARERAGRADLPGPTILEPRRGSSLDRVGW